MVLKVIFLYILVADHLRTYVCNTNCLPVECFKSRCLQGTCLINSTCVNVFNVSINSTGSKLQDGNGFTLYCLHDIPIQINVTYIWEKDSIELEEHQRNLTVKKALPENAGQYICTAQSQCGNYSSGPHSVTVDNNNIVILVVCGCAALGLIVIMGIAMKIKMHRDKAKNKLRAMQRVQEIRQQQDLQNRGPGPNAT